MKRGRPTSSSIASLVLALSLSWGASSGDPSVPPDESLTPDQYQQLGFPRLTADWTSEERARARAILRKLAEERPERLPRFASESSGVVFAKLVHEEFDRRGALEGEVGLLTGDDLEGMQSDELVRLIQEDNLEGIYAPESTGNLLFDRELVHFASQRLRGALALCSDVQARLAEQETSPTHGQGFAAQYREMLQVNEQILVELLRSIAGFAVEERFTPAGRSDAVSHLVEQVPQVAPRLSPEARVNLHRLIAEASASPASDPRLLALSRQW